MKSGETLACRVLQPRTINGRACKVGDIVYLDQPARGFLVLHGVVELQSSASYLTRDEAAPESGGDDGAPV